MCDADEYCHFAFVCFHEARGCVVGDYETVVCMGLAMKNCGSRIYYFVANNMIGLSYFASSSETCITTTESGLELASRLCSDVSSGYGCRDFEWPCSVGGRVTE